jgi:hypothetical protein
VPIRSGHEVATLSGKLNHPNRYDTRSVGAAIIFSLHFPVGLSTSASSHHDLSLAAFITDIVESDFSVHTGLAPAGSRQLCLAPSTHSITTSASASSLSEKRIAIIREQHPAAG